MTSISSYKIVHITTKHHVELQSLNSIVKNMVSKLTIFEAEKLLNSVRSNDIIPFNKIVNRFPELSLKPLTRYKPLLIESLLDKLKISNDHFIYNKDTISFKSNSSNKSFCISPKEKSPTIYSVTSSISTINITNEDLDIQLDPIQSNYMKCPPNSTESSTKTTPKKILEEEKFLELRNNYLHEDDSLNRVKLLLTLLDKVDKNNNLFFSTISIIRESYLYIKDDKAISDAEEKISKKITSII